MPTRIETADRNANLIQELWPYAHVGLPPTKYHIEQLDKGLQISNGNISRFKAEIASEADSISRQFPIKSAQDRLLAYNIEAEELMEVFRENVRDAQQRIEAADMHTRIAEAGYPLRLNPSFLGQLNSDGTPTYSIFGLTESTFKIKIIQQQGKKADVLFLHPAFAPPTLTDPMKDSLAERYRHRDSLFRGGSPQNYHYEATWKDYTEEKTYEKIERAIAGGFFNENNIFFIAHEQNPHPIVVGINSLHRLAFVVDVCHPDY